MKVKAYEDLINHLKSKDKEKEIDPEVLRRKEQRDSELEPKAKEVLEAGKKKKKKLKLKKPAPRPSEEGAGLPGYS